MSDNNVTLKEFMEVKFDSVHAALSDIKTKLVKQDSELQEVQEKVKKHENRLVGFALGLSFFGAGSGFTLATILKKLGFFT